MEFRESYGYCPTQGKNYSIRIKYIDSQTPEGKREYCRGTGRCAYKKSGNICNIKCPLVSLAPEKL